MTVIEGVASEGVVRALSAADATLRGAGQRLLDRHPQLEPALLAARDAYARSYVRARTLVNARRYDAPIDPYRLVRVDPAAVETVRAFPAAQFRNAGAVVGGDWDRSDERFTDLDVYRAYVRHFEEDVPWEETAFFDRVVAELEEGAVKWGCETEREFRERCERLDELYASIAEHGYRSQAELQVGTVEDPIRAQRSLKTELLKDEIALNVARDGELLFEDGRNRLSIAKIQGIDRVPARVLRRHEQWQAVRDAYVRGEPWAREHGDHPDLRSLEFDSR